MNRVHVWMMAIVLLGWQGWGWAQELPTASPPSRAKTMFTSPVPEDLVLRVFSLKEVEIGAARDLINLHAFRTAQVGPRSLAVYATADQMPRIEKLVAGLDVPLPGAMPQPPMEKQWRVVVFLLATGEVGNGQAVPAVLQPVVKELEQTFPYRGYTLRDSFPVLVTPGSNTTVSSLLGSSASTGEPDQGSVPYTVIFTRTVALPRSEGIGGEVAFKYPVRVAADAGGASRQYSFSQLSIQSKVSLAPGESVVLGKVSGSDAGGNLFVVLHMPKQ